MSLLQISEPGQSEEKQACKKRVVGIDLGTTNSLIAHVADAQTRILRGADGSALVPSVVHYPADGGAAVVGDAARELAAEHPERTLSSVKRLVGRSLADVEAIEKLVPYQLVDDGQGRMVKVQVGDRAVTPVETSAEILKSLLARADEALGGPAEGAVITVPAYFDDAQRQATRDAGRLAGVEVLRLLAEPTAAAVAYGLDRDQQGTYAVYDLGGGTFDISILKLVDGVFEVKATGGDSALGGDDFDREVAGRMLREAGQTDPDRGLVRRAIDAARAVKEALTDADTAAFILELGGGKRFERPVARAEFAEWIRPQLDTTAKACRRALKDAEVAAADLDGVILVGGSTRSPAVQAFVTELFGREPLCELDPEHVVAMGAAAQADMLAGGDSQILLLDVVPLSLGIETMGGVVEKLIHRNSTIPTGAKQTFTTYADKQTGFDIHIVQGERETVDACRSLARFYLKGIPPMPAGMARVEITFVIDADGILQVGAKEEITGIENSIEVKPSYGLTDEEVEQMLVDSFDHAEDDLAARNLQIERVEAERILSATRAAMEADPELLDDEVRAATEKAMATLEELARGTDHVAIRNGVEALDHASKPFAEKRMNRAIALAMQGKTVSDVEEKVH